jgi:hypothetical protein
MNPNSNVTPIESKQAAPAAAKFSITCTLEGFPIQVEVEGNADKLRAMIDRLKAIGAQPPTTAKPGPTKAAGAPLCPVHKAPMKTSQKPGTYFCPKKNEDDSYCRQKA